MIPTLLVMISCLFQYFLCGKFWNHQCWHTWSYAADKIGRKSKTWTQSERWSFKNVEKHFRSHGKRVNSHGFPWKCWNCILEVCWPALTTVLSMCLYLWFQLLIFQNYLPGEFPAQKTVQIELVKKPSNRGSCIFGVLGQCLPLFSKNFSVASFLYLMPIFSSILGQDTYFLP